MSKFWIYPQIIYCDILFYLFCMYTVYLKDNGSMSWYYSAKKIYFIKCYEFILEQFKQKKILPTLCTAAHVLSVSRITVIKTDFIVTNFEPESSIISPRFFSVHYDGNNMKEKTCQK